MTIRPGTRDRALRRARSVTAILAGGSVMATIALARTASDTPPTHLAATTKKAPSTVTTLPPTTSTTLLPATVATVPAPTPTTAPPTTAPPATAPPATAPPATVYVPPAPSSQSPQVSSGSS